MVIVREVHCKSILTRSGIPSVDYAINPYVGCEHGCVYCYAVFMKRFTGHREAWGEFVDVRFNAPDVPSRQLRRARPGTVTLGTVTDAYQPLERKYRLARGCLQALAPRNDLPTTVLTKSALVLRDLDVLLEMHQVEVAFTLTSLDDSIQRTFEPRASTAAQRLGALAQLHDAGIRTWAFFGPALPVLSDSQQAIDMIFAALARVGVAHVLVDAPNLRGAQWGRVLATLKRQYPELVDLYHGLRRDRRGYASALAQRVARASQRHNLPFQLVA